MHVLRLRRLLGGLLTLVLRRLLARVFLPLLFLLLFLFLGLPLRLVRCVFLEVERMQARLVFHVRHRPERQHFLDGRDEERVRRHFLETCRHCADELAVHIDRTAAHALQDAACLRYDRPRRLRHNHRRRSLAVIQRTDDVHVEIADLPRGVDDRIRRPRHPGRNLRRLPRRRHRERRERQAPAEQSGHRGRCLLHILMQKIHPIRLRTPRMVRSALHENRMRRTASGLSRYRGPPERQPSSNLVHYSILRRLRQIYFSVSSPATDGSRHRPQSSLAEHDDGRADAALTPV